MTDNNKRTFESGNNNKSEKKNIKEDFDKAGENIKESFENTNDNIKKEVIEDKDRFESDVEHAKTNVENDFNYVKNENKNVQHIFIENFLPLPQVLVKIA